MGSYRIRESMVVIPNAPWQAEGRQVVLPAHVRVRTAKVGALARAMGFLPMLCATLLVGALCVTVVAALRDARRLSNYRARLVSVDVIAPQSVPETTQESIDAAVELFSIDVGRHVRGPVYDPTLEDRGLTTGGTMGSFKNVSIGPAAFTSWAILGSTLGHETEVHARQSFLKVVLLDRLGTFKLNARTLMGRVIPSWKPTVREMYEQGTWGAEREAYLYEVKNARRFKLNDDEMASILQVMDFYYPNDGKVQGQL